ncbi:MAG TPA: WXG100 family type VII secretion target [Candidatus Dormibacteraeota bacterium]|nr:WXG100 family type VII secretion target [Candidatus Dormibacteraeota bacterium]
MVLRLTQGELQQKSSELNSSAAEIDSQLQLMNSRIGALVEEDWEGAARDRFFTLWQEFQQGSRECHEALVGIAQLLQQAGMTFQETEEAVAAKFRS